MTSLTTTTQSSPLVTFLGLQPGNEKLSQYEYRPLPDQIRYLRLLIIHPGSVREDLRCTLSHSSFAGELQQPCPEYEALSYTWGSDKKSHAILIDGMISPVTKNLHAALQRFRLQDKPRTLWVDALCINQDDTPERNNQVRSMDLIYKSSKMVLVWLGEEDEHTEEALNIIKLFDERSWAEKGGQVPQLRSQNEDFFISLVPSPTCTVNWHSVSLLLSRPWFSRAWVIQEAVLAPEGLIVCGSHECSWKTLDNMLGYLRLNSIRHCLATYRQASLIADLRNTWDQFAEEEPLNLLLFFLILTPDFLCQDPRDRVFSLMGLISCGRSPVADIDYSISCGELYTQVAMDVIRSGSDVAWWMLSNAQHEKPSSFNLPSWVPDWSLGMDGTSGNSLIWNEFMAGGKLSQSMTVSDMGEVLILKGMAFDTIHCVGEQLPKCDTARTGRWDDFLDDASKDDDMYQKIEQIAWSTQPYPTGEDVLDVVSQIMVAPNTTGSSERIYNNLPFRQCYSSLRYAAGHLEDIKASRLENLDTQVMEFCASEAALAYISRMAVVASQRKFGSSKKRYLGWLPEPTKVGDIIFIPFGSEVPYILRKGNDDHYKLIGECYFHGIMHGEALGEEDLTGSEFKIR